MDEKARFQKIQSLLERYMYQYKNCFPNTIWQMVGEDIPAVMLIVSAFLVIRLLGVGFWGIALMILCTLPFIVNTIWETKDIWSKIRKKRKTYRDDLQAILDKINAIDTSEFEHYPDIKRYLEKYHSELSYEILRKKSIIKKHKKIRIIGLILIVAGALLTYTTETRIKLFNPDIAKPRYTIEGIR